MAAAPAHRLRVLIGVALAALLGAGLVRSFVAGASRQIADDAEERKAVVALEAVSSLLQRAGGQGDIARSAVAAWQARTPSVSHVRVFLSDGMRLEVSTAPGDAGERAAPRRLQREEKPLYDRNQRIAAAVRTNREEQQARKAEIEAAPLGGGRLSLAGPVEKDGAPIGMVEIETALQPAPPPPGWSGFLLAVIAPLAAFGLAALVIGERRVPLLLAGAACVAVSLFWMDRAAASEVGAEQQRAAQSVAERVREQAALTEELAKAQGLKAPAPAPASWDVDGFRKPRGLLSPDGSVDAERLAEQTKEAAHAVRQTVLVAGVLALALLLLAGLGGFHALGITLRRHRQAYLYIAPAMLGMLVLVFFPFAYGVTLSFTDSNLYNTSRPLSEIWVGLRNYADIVGDFGFIKKGDSGTFVNYLNFYWTLFFTIIWTVTNVAIGVTSGLILALILNTKALALRPIYRVLLILPWAMPNYITALIWKGMFHQQFGVINQLLQVFGFPAVSWFDRPATSFLTALVTNAWLSFPFMMVVSLGALQSISADLYEAARVDGASRWQQFKAITLPSLRPALVPAVIISVVWTFNMFNIIYLVTGGEPGSSTEILVTQAYKFAFERYRYGYAAAYSTVIFGILLVYGMIQNRVSRATEA
jgi:arabinogalactan oligomer / maltooligosaccharide transport system permease protein